MNSSIQTNDPLQRAQGIPSLEELLGGYIWIPAPVSPQNALRLLEQLYPGLAWNNGKRPTEYTPPDTVTGFAVVRLRNTGNSYRFYCTHRATSFNSPFRFEPGPPLKLMRIEA